MEVRSTSHGRNARGFSLIEVQIAVALLLVGLLGLASATTVGMSTMAVNRENALAVRTAQQVLETLENGEVPFDSLFTALCSDPVTTSAEPRSLLEPITTTLEPVLDPLTGEPSVPLLSRQFDVKGLTPCRNDSDGMIGEVILPVADVSGVATLREDIAKRDLNGDGVIDTLDHSADYKILPVTVRVEWAGRDGTRLIELHTLLTKRR